MRQSQSHSSGSKQLQQVLPQPEHVVLASVHTLNVVIGFVLELLSDRDDCLDSLFVCPDVSLDCLVLLHGGLHSREVETEIVLRDESLVLTEPRLSHASLAVETRCQLG